eukprot:10181613-Alexandrium_andersonii.AAC.1
MLLPLWGAAALPDRPPIGASHAMRWRRLSGARGGGGCPPRRKLPQAALAALGTSRLRQPLAR